MGLLEIDQEEVARYLGYGSSPMEGETLADVQWAVEELRRVAVPRSMNQVFDLNKKETITLQGTCLRLVGEDIGTLLAECHQCALLAVTLGQGVDQLLRQLQVTNLARSVVVDACASSMVEVLCNEVDKQCRTCYRAQGLWMTERFSPGYGDLPLATQSMLCNVLSTQKKMGLTVTNAGIMVPRKSITALIGVSRHPQTNKKKGCDHCSLAPHCLYRKGGTTCDC